jgi:hypothetical protein
MALKRAFSILSALVVLCASMFAADSSSKGTSATHSAVKTTSLHRVAHHKRSRKPRVRGQKAIDTDRARQIQEALIREHYLKGQPSGQWDAQTQQAMQHYQADQGWQKKTVPDARALIRLGLGPGHEHLLNPESAMTTEPAVPRSIVLPAKSSSVRGSTPVGNSLPAGSPQMSAPAAVISGPPAQ